MKTIQKNLIVGALSSTLIITFVIVIASIIYSSIKLTRRKQMTSVIAEPTPEYGPDVEKGSPMVDLATAIRNTRINNMFCSTYMSAITWIPDEYLKAFFNVHWFTYGITDWMIKGVMAPGGITRLSRDGNGIRFTMEEIMNLVATASGNAPSVYIYKPMLFSMIKNRFKPLGVTSFKSAFRASLLMKTSYGINKTSLSTTTADGQYWKTDTSSQWSSLTTTTENAYIYGNITPCKTILLVLRGYVNDAGSNFEVDVDGTIVLTSTTKNQQQCVVSPSTGNPIVFLIRDLPLQAHVVRITKKDAGGTLTVIWGACSTLTEFPEFVIVKENYLSSVGYEALRYPIPAEYKASEYPAATNADMDYWNGLIDEVIDELPEEMKNSDRIKRVDLNAAGFNPDKHLLENGIMANDLGNLFIGDQILNKIADIDMRNGANILTKPADIL